MLSLTTLIELYLKYLSSGDTLIQPFIGQAAWVRVLGSVLQGSWGGSEKSSQRQAAVDCIWSGERDSDHETDLSIVWESHWGLLEVRMK